MTTNTPGFAAKKNAALRVFGESLIYEDDSLSYSVGSDKSLRDISVGNDENNVNVNTVAFPPSSTMTPPKAKQTAKESKSVSFALPMENQENNKNNSDRDTQVRELFQSQRSPLRPDLVQRTQDAINRATMSVNGRILMERNGLKPKKLSQEKSTRAAPVKAKHEWKGEIQAARHINDQMQQSRLRVLAFKKLLSSHGSRERARRQKAQYSTSLAKVEKESEFKSMVYREHQKRLKEEEDRRRRMSVEARAKLRQNAMSGKERLKMQRIDEEMAVIEERHEASIALRQKQASDTSARRKSFAFRNGDARRIRELHHLMEEERQRKEHQDFLLKEESCRDMDAYKRQQEEERRKSLAQRNLQASKWRQNESEKLAMEEQEKQKSYQLKFEAERDAEAYKKQLEEERRMSLARRNEEARRQREKESSEKGEELQATHESYELKWKAEKDAENYLKEQAEERRKSLQMRGHQNLVFRQEESKRLENQNLESHASFELKWAGEKDSLEYQKQLEEKRRQSLAFRNEEARRFREKQSKQQSEELCRDHETFELKWNAERDAEEYQKQQEQQRRESLAARNREGREQRKKVSQKEADSKEAEHKSFELKWAGEKDAEAYEKQMEAERRKSLANRNAEHARHEKVMKELRQIAQEKESESYALKWAGEDDAKAYLSQLEEERRQSLQLRGQMARNARQVEDELKTQEIIKMHEDEKIRAEDQRAVNEYQAECAARDRHSLEFRGKETSRRRLVAEEQEEQQQRADHEKFELESRAHKDMEEYLKECRRRRRMSLAFRAKEKRQHAEWEREQERKEIQERSRLVHGRLMDQHYVELARQEEKAKKALDDIRHINRTFNPFSSIL